MPEKGLTEKYKSKGGRIGIIMSQVKFVNELEPNPNDFWKDIGKAGITTSSHKSMLMQVVLDDGGI